MTIAMTPDAVNERVVERADQQTRSSARRCTGTGPGSSGDDRGAPASRASSRPRHADWQRRRLEARFRLRRAVVGLVAALAVGAGVLVADGVLTGPGGVPASAAGAGTATAGDAMLVRAEAGDSLWSIAEEHRGDISVRRYVEALISLNGGTVIEVGQLVRLP